tara:strand:+ start:719 stop:976 length:258 start_codon:yes stop_codon:yes gene_type:complete
MKYTPEVWKLKGVIEEQKRIIDSQKEAHYVLGERSIEGSQEEPKKQPKKDDDIIKRLGILEAKIKRLAKVEKDVEKLKRLLGKNK